MDTKLDFKIQTVVDEYEVIGSGDMIKSPCQIGGWWVTPAKEYKGDIPYEAQKKLYDFVCTGVEIKGILIADDMRDVKARKEKEERERLEAIPSNKPSRQNIDTSFWGDFFSILSTVLFLPLMLFDPMLVVVLSSGEWICLASWYE